jgi:hypothetical protein
VDYSAPRNSKNTPRPAISQATQRSASRSEGDAHGFILVPSVTRYVTPNLRIPICDCVRLGLIPSDMRATSQLNSNTIAPLKISYGRQIETFVPNLLNHITKIEFLLASKEAFTATFTEQNIKSGFRATGLVPYDPKNVHFHSLQHVSR